jgi:hypothetical protein
MLPSTIQSRDSGPATWRGWPWLVIGAMLGVTVVALRLEGRIWWCDEGDWAFWISDVWTSHCSQHFADPYTITHLSHGLIFWTVMYLGARWFPRLAVPERWRLSVAVGIAAAWEIVENSAFIINRYRTVTMSLDYIGDSVANAGGDVAACGLGFVIAKRVGWKWAMGIFAATEVFLFFWMRDNLTLNVIMLLWPVQAIKDWQSSGHIAPPPG